MAVIDDQMLRALTFVATRLRPAHSPHAAWDEAGIAACIAKVRHLDAESVTRAVVNASTDPTAHTPGLIADTTSSAWRERTPQATSTRARPADLHECPTHRIQYRDFCTGCRVDELVDDREGEPA